MPQEHVTDLIGALGELREHMLEQAAGLEPDIAAVDPAYRAGARNLGHHLGLRQLDIRRLQDALSELGLSSLGRCESHALASVDAVVRAAKALLGQNLTPLTEECAEIVSPNAGAADLAEHTRALLGPEPDGRKLRIMVTLPTEAATSYSLVRALIDGGMNCARINCAHDDVEVWRMMAGHVRQAARELQLPCSILADLAGAKLRILQVPVGPALAHWRPHRDASGGVQDSAHVWLTWTENGTPVESDGGLRVPRRWLTQLQMGDRLKLRDLRGKRRCLTVTEVTSKGCWADGWQSAYVGHDTCLRIARRASGARAAWPECYAQPCGTARPSLVVHRGNRLVLTPAEAAPPVANGTSALPRISCSLPSPPTGICPDAPIWFDDGKVGGRVRRVENGEVEVEITLARQAGTKLRADRSINLPESLIERPSLLPKDLQDLDFVTDCADMVGLSFAESAEGILELSEMLRRRTSRSIGIVLKIETQVGFEHLPELLLAAMRHFPVGVMIARGDLAVECGYERMAEVQEEMLWMCEAAHLPVIWATQVLDQLARSGQPSRAEITDAAMAERAECVMLNKGPHILEAVHTLSDIATRMQAHQQKKRSLLRKLHVSTR